ncbi:PKD domain-containing protein [Actinocorallia sp. API 0066]|uniref:PKD domain-containing protein n=1 Tax=Actinocorallia sp. API 0066 TaxID=2896846 RepID=UPI001E3C9D8D|nr:PKD domain-containing protein [Actinocorallia sp. API 0066]MCD0451551.1 PKD domain-containing protein [Actinocorallia sp. API 0066]
MTARKNGLENRERNLPQRPAALLSATALALAALGVTAPAPATAAAPSPSRYLLVGGTASMDVGVFGVGADVELTPVPGTPFAAGTGFALAITPDAKTVYVGSLQDKAIHAFRLGADGGLTKIPGGTTDTETPVIGVAVTPDGKRVFATIGGLNGKVRSYDIKPDGTLKPTGRPEARIPGLSTLSQPVITPNGDHLYVTGFIANNVTAFKIAADGGLTKIAEYKAGTFPALPSVTPDGKHLYIANEMGGDVSGYRIGADGKLTPTPGSPYKTVGLPHGFAITADSSRVYVPSAAGALSGFTIGADGALTALPGSPYPTPSGTLPGRAVLSPDETKVLLIDALTTQGNSRIHTYDVKPDGSLTASARPSVDSGVSFSDGPSGLFTPNLGPVAALKVTGTDGLTRTFSAKESRDPDGTVAKYRWTFGDGTTKTTTEPTVSHTYGAKGTHTVTVVVTDNEGCSTAFVYTGQTAHCSGGAAAKASTKVTLR